MADDFDIVDLLRVMVNGGINVTNNLNIIAKAADEIERLRHIIDNLQTAISETQTKLERVSDANRI